MLKTYHVYLRVDAHIEVKAESPDEADNDATERMEQAIALTVTTPPLVVVTDVCDRRYQSIDY